MSQKPGAEGTGLRRGPCQDEAGGTRQGQSRAEAGASPEVQVQTQIGHWAEQLHAGAVTPTGSWASKVLKAKLPDSTQKPHCTLVAWTRLDRG